MREQLWKAMFEAMGWGFTMIGDFQGFTLTAPANEDLACKHCGSAMLEVMVLITADAHGHAMPCGCKMMPIELLETRVDGK